MIVVTPIPNDSHHVSFTLLLFIDICVSFFLCNFINISTSIWTPHYFIFTTWTTIYVQHHHNHQKNNQPSSFGNKLTNIVTDFTAAGVPAIYPPSAMQYQPFYQYYSVPMVIILTNFQSRIYNLKYKINNFRMYPPFGLRIIKVSWRLFCRIYRALLWSYFCRSRLHISVFAFFSFIFYLAHHLQQQQPPSP